MSTVGRVWILYSLTCFLSFIMNLLEASHKSYITFCLRLCRLCVYRIWHISKWFFRKFSNREASKICAPSEKWSMTVELYIVMNVATMVIFSWQSTQSFYHGGQEENVNWLRFTPLDIKCSICWMLCAHRHPGHDNQPPTRFKLQLCHNLLWDTYIKPMALLLMCTRSRMLGIVKYSISDYETWSKLMKLLNMNIDHGVLKFLHFCFLQEFVRCTSKGL